MRTKQIAIEEISIDGGTQVRELLDTSAVCEYEQFYKNGTELPPLVVFWDGSTNWLADGFHRYFGARSAFILKLPCEVHNGTVDDARLFAAGANQSHGVRRTNADKRRAVEMCLANPKSSDWADNKIGEHVGVSHSTVASVRDQLANLASSTDERPRLGKDGKRRKAKPKKRRQIEVVSDPEPDDTAVSVDDDEPEEEEAIEPTPPKAAATPYRDALALLRKAFEICPASLWPAALSEAADW